MGQGLLSPPILATTIPAFCSNDLGTLLYVPFSMNKSVGAEQISGFKVKIKSVQSGNTLGTYDVDITNNKNDIMADSQFTVSIGSGDTKPTWLRVGQFYKVQVAYKDVENNVGYYSSIAVTKYTSKPSLSINLLDIKDLNSHLYTYQGIYIQDDLTERPYLYRFDLYDGFDDLIATSGDLLHNSEEDDSDNPKSARDIFTFAQDLGANGPYKIQYTVTTNNDMVVSSPKYRIIQKRSINPELDASVQVSLNYENGYVGIQLVAAPSEEIKLVTGSFIVTRSCEDTDFSIWDEIHRFKLVAQIPTIFLCKDFTVEQGKRYRYAVQQYSDTLISNRLLSDVIYVDFEDAFLYDGERQLKIKYNPKVSSFKKDLLETKTDTIGGKYPFIFRNGRVYYSEFSISGLISYQMDEENLFLSEEEYGLTEKTANLTGENIAAEREFKMKVLEWLTNGEPKVFRSPVEGNFIVRLMNSSLAPNDTLGRMLHTFTSTAYEIADYNYKNLGDMGFITIDEGQLTTLLWQTVNFYDLDTDTGYINTGINLLDKIATTVRFDNMTPGDIIKIKFVGNPTEEEIKIGVTGSYYIDIGVNIESIKLTNKSAGSMTYSYSAVQSPKFETVHSIVVHERIGEQFIGERDILQEILYVKNGNTWVKNPKREIVNIYNIAIEKRPLQRIASEANHDDPFLMYEVGSTNRKPENEWPQPNRPIEVFTRDYYYDGYNKVEYNDDEEIYEPFVKLNGEIISVNELNTTVFSKPENVTELINGNGCLTTLAYQLADITYNIENEAKESELASSHYLYKLRQAMLNYQTVNTKYQTILADESSKTFTVYPKDTAPVWNSTNGTSTYRLTVEDTNINYIMVQFKRSRASKGLLQLQLQKQGANGTTKTAPIYWKGKRVDKYAEGEHLTWSEGDVICFYYSKDSSNNPGWYIIDDDEVKRRYDLYILALVEAQKEESRRKGEIA